ncbi:hypothetical protein H8A99_06530 [Bradyrhizobium sp. Arg68]|uniref:hypothetical protein n=1 Tax=Bradyrhizobium ivorense TaxID=2511166 RepID=UPI001E3FF3D9|nr:hypothetical protein [Bradyrhizobium ivorense]MCC8936162.1 hypothetical protein [Bradyrhizobium ivorense]
MTTTISTQGDGLLQRHEKSEGKTVCLPQATPGHKPFAPWLDRDHRRMPKPALEAAVRDRQFADRENALTLA